MAPVVLSGWAADRTPSTSREGITEGEQSGSQLSDSHCRLQWKKIDAKDMNKERWLFLKIVTWEFWENWGDIEGCWSKCFKCLSSFPQVGDFFSPLFSSGCGQNTKVILDCWGIGDNFSIAWQRGVKGPKPKWKNGHPFFILI